MAGLFRTIRPEYGVGVAEIEEDAQLDAADLRTLVQRLFATPGYKPPVLPDVALQVHQLCRRSDVSFAEVERLVATCPLQTANVIRIAQSPVYAAHAPIRSLRDATSRLGLRTLSDLFLEVSMNARVFRAKGYEAWMDALRLHSIATSNAARLLGRYGAVYEDYAYLCGLLHEVGVAAVLIALSEPTVSRELAPKLARTPASELRQLIAEMHGEGGRIVAEAWKLPPDVALVIQRHHEPVVDGHPFPGTATLVLAEAVAATCGFPGIEPVEAPMLALAAKATGIDGKTLERVRGEVEKLMQARV